MKGTAAVWAAVFLGALAGLALLFGRGLLLSQQIGYDARHHEEYDLVDWDCPSQTTYAGKTWDIDYCYLHINCSGVWNADTWTFCWYDENWEWVCDGTNDDGEWSDWYKVPGGRTIYIRTGDEGDYSGCDYAHIVYYLYGSEHVECEGTRESCCDDSDCTPYCGSGNVLYSDGYCPSKGSECQYRDSVDCDDSDGWYCEYAYSQDRVYRDYYCSGGQCKYTITNRESCGTDGYICIGNNRYYRDYYCTSAGPDEFGHCTYQDSFVETCPYGCENGYCVTPTTTTTTTTTTTLPPETPEAEVTITLIDYLMSILGLR